MSLRAGGKYLCDRCGRDVDNASIFDCSIISDVMNNEIRILHFCRDHEVNGKMIDGCTKKVLSEENLANMLGDK